jgi:hypothetical protein
VSAFLHLFRLIGKLAVQAVVNYVSFCHTCLHKIQKRTNVPTIRQSEQYKRHRPEATLLYQLVERYYLGFTVNLAEQGKYLPKYVEREFDEFLRCGRLEYGFLRVVCGYCKHEKLVACSTSAGASVQAVEQDEWLKAQRCWLMISFEATRFAIGC